VHQRLQGEAQAALTQFPVHSLAAVRAAIRINLR
jgi:hypothetical protein